MKMTINEMNLLPAGTLVANRYEIIEAIGQGGFGITYKGYDSVLDVPVAIKEYYPSGIASRYHEQSLDVQVGGSENRQFFENGKKKFLEEARVLARFSEDPNVVGVRDFFEDNQTVYIVMQFLQGESLKEYIEKNGNISFDEAFNLLRPVMQSLGRIHATGLIHRDISPSNLIRMRGGKVKLIDFGTAREFGANGEKSLSVVLKPGYSPAEQYNIHGVQGPWTDVYALCASIYKLITGITPDNSLNRMLEDELRLPSECGAIISASQEKVLMQGLAVRESERIRSMESLEEKFDAASLINEADNNDHAAAYDDERTVMGPSAASSSENGRAPHMSVNDQPQKPVNDHPQKPVNDQPHKPVNDQQAASRRADDSLSERQTDASFRNQKSPAPDRQPYHSPAGKEQENPVQRLGKGKKSGDDRRKDSAKKGKRVNLIPIFVCILAAALLFGVLHLRSNGTGGGEISSWGSDSKIVKFGSLNEEITVSKSMLDSVDRNKDVTALRFFRCTLSDEIIERIASMKRINYVDISSSSGFSTLTPLSNMNPLRKLILRGSSAGDKPIFDGTAMFAADFPQLTDFELDYHRLENGFGFLEHFSGLETLYVSSLERDGGSDRIPENAALKSVSILETDLTGVDLSAFGNEPNLESLRLDRDHLTELSFLSTASALKEVSASGNELTSLNGLQGKERLNFLDVHNNQLRDISAISTSVELHQFSAFNNQIEDISVLENCKDLMFLLLGNNQISDISSLSGCTKLYKLELQDNQIQDASPLSNCHDLEVLNLDGNRLTDLSCLSECEKLESLSFRRNAVSDLKFCENMIVLESLRASDNQISTLDGLQNVTQLKEVRLDKNKISDISLLAKNGEHLEVAILDENQISDLTPLMACTNLKGLSVNKNQLTTLRGLQECQKLYFLSASGNRISDISALESCPELYMADLGENQLTDVSALGASVAPKMALLLQNNKIKDISTLIGTKDYVYLSLYNNEITDISGMPAMTGIGTFSTIYLDWWEDLDPVTLSEIPYGTPCLVDTPADRKMNLLNKFQESRNEAGKYSGSIEYLTKEEVDEEIRQLRSDARVSADIDEKPEETEEIEGIEGTEEAVEMEETGETEEVLGTGETEETGEVEKTEETEGTEETVGTEETKGTE